MDYDETSVFEVLLASGSEGILLSGSFVLFRISPFCLDNALIASGFLLISHSVDSTNRKGRTKRRKMSKKAKLNGLHFYRLKAKKKMNSPNPEVRMRYTLEKAKRKEAWLIKKFRKYEVPKAPTEAYDPEILTEEEKHYLKRTGEKKKNNVQVGRRGVFGGVVLNMHLHWKKHEIVKVTCKPGQGHDYAEELARLSKGIVIDIKPNNTIIFYRGKNYVRPKIMSPSDTLSKNKALEKYKYEQSLDHTSEFVEKLEKELKEYLEHKARYKKAKEGAPQDFLQVQVSGKESKLARESEVQQKEPSSELLKIKHAYQTRYNSDLEKDLTMKVNGGYKEIMLAVLKSCHNYGGKADMSLAMCDAKTLYEALESGKNVDKKTITSVLSQRNNGQVRATLSSYKQLYGHEFGTPLREANVGNLERNFRW
ncbi:hypothetical protein CRYUN_Cryun18bG0078000 [Craigia yunnanensis]